MKEKKCAVPLCRRRFDRKWLKFDLDWQLAPKPDDLISMHQIQTRTRYFQVTPLGMSSIQGANDARPVKQHTWQSLHSARDLPTNALSLNCRTIDEPIHAL